MSRRITNILFYVIAGFYVFFMLDLFFRFDRIFDMNRMIIRSYNLIPFKTIWEYATGSEHALKAFAAGNIFGNIIVFIPYGLYLQVIKKHKAFIKSLLIVLITTAAIELIQFTFGLGALDIDDVLLNCVGGIIGILGYKFLLKLLKKENRTRLVITILSLVIGIPVIYLLLFRLHFSL